MIDSFLGFLCLFFMNGNFKYRKEEEEANERISEVLRREEEDRWEL